MPSGSFFFFLSKNSFLIDPSFKIKKKNEGARVVKGLKDISEARILSMLQYISVKLIFYSVFFFSSSEQHLNESPNN